MFKDKVTFFEMETWEIMNALLKDIHVLNFNSNHRACKLMPEWTCFSFYLEKGEGRENYTWHHWKWAKWQSAGEGIGSHIISEIKMATTLNAF